jgi:hypothetical protein
VDRCRRFAGVPVSAGHRRLAVKIADAIAFIEQARFQV